MFKIDIKFHHFIVRFQLIIQFAIFIIIMTKNQQQDYLIQQPNLPHRCGSYTHKRRIRQKVSIINYEFPRNNYNHLFKSKQSNEIPSRTFKFQNTRPNSNNHDNSLSKKAQTQPINEENLKSGGKYQDKKIKYQEIEKYGDQKNILPIKLTLDLKKISQNNIKISSSRNKYNNYQSPKIQKSINSGFPFELQDCSIFFEDEINHITNSLIKKKSKKGDILQKKSATKTVTEQSQSKSNTKLKHTPKVIDIFKIYELKQKGKNTARDQNYTQEIEDVNNKKRNFLSKYESNNRQENMVLPFVLESIEQIKISSFESPQIQKPSIKIKSKQYQKSSERSPKKKVKQFFHQKFNEQESDLFEIYNSESNLKTLDKHLAEINQKLKKIEDIQEAKGKKHIIPQLPSGSILSMIIYQNWGDIKSIGIHALEIYDQNGQAIIPKKVESIPQSNNESLMNLFNKRIYSLDRKMGWKTLIQTQRPNTIMFDFQKKLKISLIRIWNYNHSIKHSKIGIKTIQLKLDNNYIFGGNIRKAEGRLSNFQNTCEYLIFTNSNKILQKIQKEDWLTHIKLDQIIQEDYFEKETICNTQEQECFNQQKAPAHLYFNCKKDLEIEVVQNYGDKFEFGFFKLKMYDIKNSEIPYILRQGQLKYYNKIESNILHFSIEQNVIIQKIMIKNLENEKAIKHIIIKLDTGKIFEMKNILRKKQPQSIFLNTSIYYGNLFECKFLNIEQQQNILNCKEENIITTKEIKIQMRSNWGHPKYTGLNKIQIYDYYGIPLLKSKLINYKILFKQLEQIKTENCVAQLQYNKVDLFIESVQLFPTIIVKFFEVVTIGAIFIWNYKNDSTIGTKQFSIKCDNKIIQQGYLKPYTKPSKFSTIIFKKSLQKQGKKFKNLNSQQYFEKTKYYNENKELKAISKQTILI